MFRGKGEPLCRKVRGLLSDYVDSSLSSEDKSFVERHLHTCEACSKELESMRMTVQLLHRVPEVPVPRTFTVTVPKPKRESAFGTASLRWLRPATAIVAIALVALLAGDFSHAFVNSTGGNATYIQSAPSSATEQQVLVTVPGIMGKMPLAAAKAVGYTNYSILPPSPPSGATTEPVPVPGFLGIEGSGWPAEPTGHVVVAQENAGVGWPLRQTEIGLGAAVFVLLALMIFFRRQRKVRVTVK
jgi:hypothetical protein